MLAVRKLFSRGSVRKSLPICVRAQSFTASRRASSQFRFPGVYPILCTPFHSDESLDLPSLHRLINFACEIGVQGVTVLGVLGEANRLLDAEREAIISTAVSAASGRIPVIVGASHSGTHAAVGLSQMAQRLGASAVMLTPHAEAAPNDDRVFHYFKTVAGAIQIPIIVQDHPASTGVHMGLPLMLKILEQITNILCVKEEATPTAPKVKALINGMKAQSRQVPLLTGLGALYAQFDLQAGSSGFNTGFAFPEVLMAMVEAQVAGDQDRVLALYRRFLPLLVFEQQPGLLSVRKELWRMRGAIDCAHVRHPGGNLPPQMDSTIQALVSEALPGIDITKPIEKL